MFSKRNAVLMSLAVIALLAFGVFTAAAQSGNNPTAPTPAQRGYGGNFGAMGMGGWMIGDDTTPVIGAFAEALGVDEQALLDELQSGKTLAQLAQENGIDLTAIHAAQQSEVEAHLQALVDAGVITQAQADERLSQLQAHWDNLPMFNGQGFFGQGYGMMFDGAMGMNARRGTMGRWH